MSNVNVTMNEEKNGIEIRFNEKPDRDVLDVLKANGFRWSKPQKMWYAKQNEMRMNIVRNLTDGKEIATVKEIKQNNDVFDLWELTRTDNIENHYEKERIHDTKEIAKRIREHLKKRFPMCKWSVRRSNYEEIHYHLLASPWDKESDEVKAIAHYAYKYGDSYNYDDSDYMTDYFDVNFYGTYESNIVEYDYVCSGCTEKDQKISEDFHKKQEEFEVAERARREKELEEEHARREKERIEYEERERVRKANHEKIMNGITVKDVDSEYFILNLKERDSKLDAVEEYENHDEYYEEEVNKGWRVQNAKIAREVRMNKDIYDLFSKQLLDDYDFLAGMGGSATDDNRINDMDDYSRMSKEERETVDWYSVKCIVVFCDDKLMMVIDPQGYGYARYVFFPTENTVVDGKYEYKQSLSNAEKVENIKIAEKIEIASAAIIADNDIQDTWDNTAVQAYKDLMKDWFYSNGIILNSAIVREIKSDKLKSIMYELSLTMNGIQEQFKRANLKEDQKITLFKFYEFGGIEPRHFKFKRHTDTTYAQYKDVVKMVFRPEGKRKDRFMYLYNDLLIFDGYVDIPEDLFWIVKADKFGITRQSKYHMFDDKMYDDILEYFGKQGIKPIINTYKS